MSSAWSRDAAKMESATAGRGMAESEPQTSAGRARATAPQTSADPRAARAGTQRLLRAGGLSTAGPYEKDLGYTPGTLLAPR